MVANKNNNNSNNNTSAVDALVKALSFDYNVAVCRYEVVFY